MLPLVVKAGFLKAVSLQNVILVEVIFLFRNLLVVYLKTAIGRTWILVPLHLRIANSLGKFNMLFLEVNTKMI